MIYLSSFMLSNRKLKNPNIYPYNVFRDKDIEPFVFSPITILYGNNGSGKSTILNVIATHSPFMLGTLSDAKIYNLDTPDCRIARWNELEKCAIFL